MDKPPAVRLLLWIADVLLKTSLICFSYVLVSAVLRFIFPHFHGLLGR